MTWRETIVKSAAFLAAKDVPEPQVAAELLAARLLGCTRGLLHTKLESEADERRLDAMRRGLARLKAGEPVQYVLGEWDFRRLTLSCDRRALIPRPETEELVGHVLDWMAAHPPSSRRLIVDVGTGSGAIAISLAQESHEDAVILATDISSAALELAAENASRNNLTDKVRFVQADGLDDFDEPESIDIIVSNPPYVTSAEWEELDPRVRGFEPRLALDGGLDGLDFYRRYLADALNLLKPGGAVFFEIGETQGATIAADMADCGFIDIAIRKDLSGRDRFACGCLP